MATITEIVAIQRQLGDMICKMMGSIKTDSNRRTRKYIIDKQKLLNDYWEEFEAHHTKLLELGIPQDHKYLENDFFKQVKTYYDECMKILVQTESMTRDSKGDDHPAATKQITIKENPSTSIQASPTTRSPYKPKAAPPPPPPKQNTEASINISTEKSTTSTLESTTNTDSKVRFNTGESENLDDDFVFHPRQNTEEQVLRIKKQKLKISSIKRLIDDIQRQQDRSHPKMYYEYKRWTLNELFNSITALHEEIYLYENEFNDSYFQSAEYENVEMLFQETMILLHESQEQQETKVVQSSEESWRRLPRQTIPRFEGSYINWTAFRDIFIKTIHENKHLCNAEKLQYLKTHLIGEASKLIKHLEISESNYEAAWNLLNERYNNKRALLFSQLELLFNQQNQNTESLTALKNMHDTTRECMHGIKSLGINTDTWGPIIVFYLLKKLDRETRRWYEQSVAEPREIPDLDEFLKFIETRFQSLENLKEQKRSYETSKVITPAASSKTATRTFHAVQMNCKYCSGLHAIYNCKKFLESTVNDRLRYIKNNKICINCLSHKEDIKCFSKKRCTICRKNHHTLLHNQQINTEKDTNIKGLSSHSTTTKKSEPTVHEATSKHVFATYKVKPTRQILLATALVKVKTAMGSFELLRALIDPGSQASFITERAVQMLALPKTKVEIEISGVGNPEPSTSRNQVFLNIMPRLPSNHQLSVNALVLPSLTKMLPSEPIELENFADQHNLILADPTLDTPSPVDILIGADVYGSIIVDGIKKLSTDLLAQKTIFGWILTGKILQEAKQHKVISLVSLIDLNKTLLKFWELEEVPQTPKLSEEDKKCQEHFKTTHVRNKDGSYTVSMPLKENVSELGESRKMAIARFLQLENRLEKNPRLKLEYHNFMKEYLELGHMKRAPLSNGSLKYYLPHQPVVREQSTTTKLRVVFDASAKTSSGISLNDTMHTGPRLQQNLVDILLRWREHKYVFKADVEKMYRMIKMAEEHQNLQRIIWRFSNKDPLQEYVLSTVTYGTASAPYLAIRTLQQLAIDEQTNYPAAVSVALNDFYVDDLMSGADSLDESKRILTEIIDLLKKGGFNLRKWCSNCKELLRIIPADLREKGLIEINDQEQAIKALGIYWSPITDSFHFKISDPCNNSAPTKRKMLSNIAKLFDPLGWLAPIIITAKILMQEVCATNASWDSELPEDLSKKWETFKTELSQIESLSIPRWIHYSRTNENIEIHGFCDASEKAYAAAIYSRVTAESGQIIVTLLTAKTKVAPIKMKKTLPRLELCGANLLARLLYQTKKAMELQHLKTYAWTDSTITLAWIKGDQEKYKSFVTNKVAEIREHTDINNWHHVPSSDNPADIASRGVNPAKLGDATIWWKGPNWLKEPSSKWPIMKENLTTTEEMKSKKIVCATIQKKYNYGNEIISKFSNLSKLLRVWAYCNRFIDVCRKKPLTKSSITLAEKQRALTNVIYIAQEQEFGAEMQKLTKNLKLDKRNTIASLNPFLDKDGLMRLGGRLDNSNLPYDEKHPIILPSKHHLTKLIIEEAHKITLHGTSQSTLAYIRRKFWIIRGKATVRNTINKCVRCARFKEKVLNQQMGTLPPHRVRPAKPFSHAGLDYAGPIKLKASRGRGITSYKGYIAIFICMATKAIHLEIVSGLATEDFLAAYKRFIARRGRCSHLYSDNATTFVGASKILERMKCELTEKGTTWHFIPPAAPHFGGIWEAGVKSVKHHLRRVIGETSLTYEEMSTLLCQIEACLNSRPLCPITEDPTEENILTPGHFLIGEAPLSPPDASNYDIKMHSLSRWQHIQKMNKDFWQVWSSDYLKQLQQRSKWKLKTDNIKIGQIVLIKDENTGPTTWPLAKVIEVHPGEDNLIRVVTLSKGGQTLKRPVTKICPLPIEVQSHDQNQTVDNSVCTNLARVITDYQSEEARTHTSETHSTIHPTNIPVRPPINKLMEREGKRRKLQLTATTVKPCSWTTALIGILLFQIISCLGQNYTIHRPKSGIYIEQLGDVRIKRGTFRVEWSFTTNEMKNDSKNTNLTITQLKKLCDETSKISTETHCDGLIHHLQERNAEIQKYINALRYETNKRNKRGLLGKFLETIFGVHDEIYRNIENLDHNQKILLQTSHQQTNIMLTTIAAVNETEVRITNKLNSFTEKLNKGLISITEMQQRWFRGPDTNQLNIHFLAAYHAASNYIDEILEKYHRLIGVYYRNGNLLDFTDSVTLTDIVTRAKKNLPANLDIWQNYDTDIELDVTEEEIKIYGYLYIAEQTKYSMIHCTAIPEQVGSNEFIIMDLPASILAINYNTQYYFTLTELELERCTNKRGYDPMCMPTVIHSIENYPNCIISELYHRHDGSKCLIQRFQLDNILWKHLYMTNTWLFVTNKPTTAALQCNGIREDILLNNTGIIKIIQDCLLTTKRNILKSEYIIKSPVIRSFAKHVPLHINASMPLIKGPPVTADIETVVRTSEQIFTALRAQGESININEKWKNIHLHAISTGISVGSVLLITIIITLTWKVIQRAKCKQHKSGYNDSISEFNLPPLSSLRQNVQA